MQRVPMTVRGYESLQKELHHLKTVERRQIIEAIASARELGDLSENAEYHAAREKQGFIEGRISELESKVSYAEVIDPKQLSGKVVRFAATVTLLDDETDVETTYQIVGIDEADIKQARLSFSAPLARSLIGKTESDTVTVHTPNGERSYTILKVEYV
ncbi:MAG: transcription elongation factor GreA [Alphaproteobacteria bacterium]|jgi:transcription elongation factor GreA|nr:transcription elongation factor GreA [Alphaproteobacteria bacterium]